MTNEEKHATGTGHHDDRSIQPMENELVSALREIPPVILGIVILGIIVLVVWGIPTLLAYFGGYAHPGYQK